jgi:hypothetical protein
MSDTPISDSTPHNVADLGMLCRRLERQLNAANERIKRLEEMYEGEIGENEQFLGSNLKGLLTRELNWSKYHIKRLEEAGDEAIYPFEYAARVRIWTEAKEAKL